MHDRSKFTVIGFSLRPDDNSVYVKNVKAGCDEYHDIP